jgi:hypothetical protein
MNMRSGWLAGYLGLGLTVLAARADAANATGTVATLEIVGTQYAILRISGSSTGTRPICHAGGLQQTAYSMDLNTPKGRSLFSFATAAQLAGRSIEVYGAGSCLTVGNPYTDVEQIARVVSNQ